MEDLSAPREERTAREQQSLDFFVLHCTVLGIPYEVNPPIGYGDRVVYTVLDPITDGKKLGPGVFIDCTGRIKIGGRRPGYELEDAEQAAREFDREYYREER